MDAAVLSLVPSKAPVRAASPAQDAIAPALRHSFRLERSWRDTVPFDGVVASRWRMPDPRDSTFERAGWGYLMHCRIERAKSLLLSADRAILDIALACGFRTHAHFGAVFKRTVGASPTGWRAQRLGCGEGLS